LLASADDATEIRELVAKVLTPGSSDGVGLAPVLCAHDWANPAAFFETRDRTVEGSRAEADASEAFDVLHHGVAVFVAPGEARQDKKCGVRHDYYVSRIISYDVVD
jgi:hypothetical protein